ncbi:MAG TPA: sulfatase-like hydrolase/transferase [Candidatus Binatia bacterium]|nr:sulfatase-like hydrolase/transferase [Candidatus Binatia bacterium]
MADRRALAQALLWFVVANVGVLFLDGYGYILAAGGTRWTPGWLFVHVALLAQLASAMLLLGGLVLGIVFLPGGRVLAPVAAPVLATALHVLLYVDRTVYAYYRFHVGGLALHLLWMPGGLAALHLRPDAPLAFAAAVAALLGLEAVGLAWLWRRARARPWPRRALGRGWAVFAGGVVVLVVVDKAVYAACDLREARDVTRAARLVPLYQPFTIVGFARHHLAFGAPAIAAGRGALPHYPRAPLRYAADAPRPNVLWVVLDSWRADSFNPDTTPALWRLGERSQVFLQHVSGGNNTRYGMFSMFYGLYAAAFDAFAEERRGPVLFDAARARGYRLEVLSTSPLAFSELRRTAFVDVQDAIGPTFDGPGIAAKDAQAAGAFARFAAAADPRPFFAVLLLESTHAGYDFDPARARYRPYSARIGFLGPGAGVRPPAVWNRYRDAVAYADDIVGGLVRGLEVRGLLASTVVVVTGDHGEEFNEHGYWGHNGAFTPEQIRVPLVLHVPGVAPARHPGLSSHHDLPATILRLIGVTNPPDDYSLGRSLLDSSGDPYAVACGADECALVEEGRTVTFGVGVHDPAGIRMTDAQYRPIAVGRAEGERRSVEVLGVLTRLSAFLR